MQLSFFRTTVFRAYPYIVAVSLLLTIAAAYFSVGNHHPDEHFQILEFANARLGLSDIKQLPWEYEQLARPTLQPLMAMGAIKIMHVIGVDNPFTIAFLIRLITGIGTWAISILMINFFIGDFKTKSGKLFFILSVLLLWFMPYLNVRFSSENMSGYSFLLGLLFLLEYLKSEHKKGILLMVGGLLFGFSFYFRFQIAAAVIGVFIWIIVYRKLSLIDILKLVGGGAIALVISIGIDSWYYESLVFTPWNYFYVQLIAGKAASFGTDPWWHYFNLFFANAVPPISIFLFVFFVIGAIKNKHSVIVYIIIPFVLMHMGIGHKEMRFLFPVLPLFLVMASLGYDNLIGRGKVHKSLLIALKVSFVINVLLIVFRTFSPAQELIYYYRFLYNVSADQNYLLVSINDDPYNYVGLPINFYRSPNIETKQFSSFAIAEDYINSHLDKPVLIWHKQLMLDHEFSNYNTKKVYSILPEWISQFDINDWQSRANLYSIYSLKKN